MSFGPDSVTMDDSASIQYPELHGKILQMATNAMVLAKLFVVDPIVKGRTRTYVKETTQRCALNSASSKPYFELLRK